jgi:hypothetical protein
MSKSNLMENSLLLLFFNATTFDNIAEDDTTSPATDLYVSLHTADPTEAGDQTSNEATYTDYARVAVARTAGGWTVSGATAENAAAIVFPEASGGSDTLTHFAIGELASGAGDLYYIGALTASLAVSTGIEPQFAAGDLTVTEE